MFLMVVMTEAFLATSIQERAGYWRKMVQNSELSVGKLNLAVPSITLLYSST